MKKPKMKPCPFCGSEKVKIYKENNSLPIGASCKCGLQISFFCRGSNVAIWAKNHTYTEMRNKIIEYWNKRAK